MQIHSGIYISSEVYDIIYILLDHILISVLVVTTPVICQYIHIWVRFNNQKHPSCKKSCSQDLKRGCDEKDVKSKEGSKGLCRNDVVYIKNFDNDDPGASMIFDLGHPYQNFNVTNSIPTQALAALLISHRFHHSLFSGLGYNIFTAMMFLVGISLLCKK